jgi:hypothetical protein
MLLLIIEAIIPRNSVLNYIGTKRILRHPILSLYPELKDIVLDKLARLRNAVVCVERAIDLNMVMNLFRDN